MQKALILILFSLFLGGACAPLSIVQPEYSSLLDTKYRLQLMKAQVAQTLSIDSGTLSFYQGFLSPVLNSSCRHYPTDSRYARLLFSNCAWSTSIIKTASRFLSESDASMLYTHQTIENNRIYHVDLPDRCSL